MKINGNKVDGDYFAYDGCHKMYIIEDNNEINEALDNNYCIYNIKNLKNIYDSSCELKFISNWKLNKNYVNQCEKAEFEEDSVIEM